MKDQIQISGIPASWAAGPALKKILKALRAQKLIRAKETVVLSVLGVGAAQMTKMNFKYRGKRRPTDVLSFEQKEARVGGVYFLGDVVLCLPVVRAQAKEQEHGVRAETAILLTHGVLHLLGFDHERSRAQAARMTRLETAVLRGFQTKTGLLKRAEYKTKS